MASIHKTTNSIKSLFTNQCFDWMSNFDKYAIYQRDMFPSGTLDDPRIEPEIPNIPVKPEEPELKPTPVPPTKKSNFGWYMFFLFSFAAIGFAIYHYRRNSKGSKSTTASKEEQT